MQGRCDCGALRYEMLAAPLTVHACHCSWCQRETGTAFALNAMIERDKLRVEGAPVYELLPSASGKGQEVARCPACHVVIFSHYASQARRLAFVRVGTLEQPALCPPQVHIFTTTKLPWLLLPPDQPQVPEYYRRAEIWQPEALARWQRFLDSSGQG